VRQNPDHRCAQRCGRGLDHGATRLPRPRSPVFHGRRGAYLWTKKTFYLNVAHALSGCQLVEQQLKLYIREALELARKCIGDKMPFNMTGDAFSTAPLERLIHAFENFCDNKALIVELGQFKKQRNLLAHSGIADCLDFDGELSYSTGTEFRVTLRALRATAQRLQTYIYEEANKFRGYLWFEPIEDGTD
jgi:hypothetical protein